MADYGGVPQIDFSILGDLGNVYKKAQQGATRERTLAELGQALQSGNVDYNHIAGALAGLGEIGPALSAIQTGQLAQNDQVALSAIGQPSAAPPARKDITSGPRPASAPPLTPVPMMASPVPESDPTMTVSPRQVAAVNGPAPAASAPQQTPIVWGDGAVTTPGATPPTRTAQAPLTPPAPRQDQATPQGRTLTPQQAQLVGMMRRVSPGLQAGLGKVLEHSLKSGDPPDSIKIADALRIDPRGLTPEQVQSAIYHRISGLTSPGDTREKEYDRVTGGELAKFNFEIIKGAGSASTKVATLDRLDQLLSNPSVYQGTGGNFVAAIKRAGASFGYDVEGASNVDAVRSIGRQFALELRNPAGGAGMPGAMSDGDRKYLESMPPGLENTAEGNKLIADFMRRVSQRSVDVERKRQEYVRKNGRLGEGFFTELADWSDKNPLFSEKDKFPTARGGASDPLGIR